MLCSVAPALPEDSRLKSLESRAQMPQLAGLKPAQKRKIHQELESGSLRGDAQWASRDEVWDDEPLNPSPTKSLTVDSLSIVSAPPAASFAAQHYRNDGVGVGRGTTGPAAGASGAFAAGAGATSVSYANSGQQQQQRIPGSYAAAAGAAASSSSATNSNSNRRLSP